MSGIQVFFFSYLSKYYLPQRTRKTDKKAQCQPKTKFAPPSSLCLCFVSYVHVVLLVFLILSLSCLFNRCFCPFFFFNSEILLYSHFFFILILFLFSYFVTSLINRILKKVSHNSTHPMNKNLHPFNINFEGAFGFLFSLQKIIVFFVDFNFTKKIYL